MREIKFRGLRTDGKGWVYGDLNQNDIHNGVSIRQNGCIVNAVIPESVGQFTGIKLKDKKETEIYEGDVLSAINADNVTVKGVVQFGTARRIINCNKVDITGFYFFTQNGFKSFPIAENYAGKHDLEMIKIVGNIHQNPELL